MASLSNLIQDFKDWKNFDQNSSKIKNIQNVNSQNETIPYIRYEGNGGYYEKGSFKALFEKKHISGQEEPEIIQYLSGRKIVLNGFIHKDGVFCGYLLRKRVEGHWLWYTESGEWQETLSEMNQKKLFHNNENIADLVEQETKNGTQYLVFQAQWKHRFTKKMINSGYEFFQNQLVAHALGGFDGRMHLNTRKAFDQSLKNGFKYFETDLSYTEDGKLAVFYGWNRTDCDKCRFPYDPSYEHMTYDMLNDLKLTGEPVMDAEELYKLILEYPDVRFMIDIHKYADADLEKQIRALIEAFHYDISAIDHLVIQLYNYEMYYSIEKVYHFKYYQLIIGKDFNNVSKHIDFCLDHGICATAMRFNTTIPAYVKQVKNAGLYIESYSIKDNLSLARYIFSMGVDTICTDFLTPEIINDKTRKTDISMDYYPIQIYYHSGVNDVCEQYQNDEVVYLKSGNIEYQDSYLWKNDGTERLKKNRFSLAGKRFAGWKMRIFINDKTLWFCDDGYWRLNSDFTDKFLTRPVVFNDEDILPKFLVRKKTKFVMVAVWEDCE